MFAELFSLSVDQYDEIPESDHRSLYHLICRHETHRNVINVSELKKGLSPDREMAYDSIK